MIPLIKQAYYQSGQCSNQHLTKITDLSYDQLFQLLWTTWAIVRKSTKSCIPPWCTGEPHTSVVYGNMCTHTPAHTPSNRTVSVPFMWYCPRCHAMPRSCLWWWTVQCVVLVVIALRLRTPTMGKRKAETPVQQTARLEWETDQRTASYLASLLVLPFLALTYVSFLTGHFTQTLFHTSKLFYWPW